MAFCQLKQQSTWEFEQQREKKEKEKTNILVLDSGGVILLAGKDQKATKQAVRTLSYCHIESPLLISFFSFSS